MDSDRKEQMVIGKFRKIKIYFDKLFILTTGSLWIISFLWDILRLQRFWFDYMMELYSSFFILFMMLYSINPKFLPVKIYKLFSIITTMKGRGTLLLLISFVFLGDFHLFHKFCAVLFLVGGILYFICEILVPTTKEEFAKIEEFFNGNETKSVSIDNDKNEEKYPSDVVIPYGNAFTRGGNRKKSNDKDNNNSIESNNNVGSEESNESGENNFDNKNNKLPVLEDKIKDKKNENPYALPEF